MKIIIHGATHSSNFGDFLFAKIFYEALSKENHEVYFYDIPKIGMSNFFKKFLSYNKTLTKKDISESDALVYMSGGYFGERTKTLEETAIRYIRYIPIGQRMMRLKKKIYIIGVGGAPISNKILRKKFVKLINYARLVIFRDEATTKYYEKNGAKNSIITTTDTALLLSKTIKINKEKMGIKLNSDNKHIFLHLSGDEKTDNIIIRTVIPAINKFQQNNKKWTVIIGQDNICKNDRSDEVYKIIKSNNKQVYHYEDPMELYNLLGNVDLILTPKLHVGIVGASLKRSVISFPYHAGKTTRFYEQIGYSDRCTPITVLNRDKLLTDMNKYKDEQIIIPDRLIRLSQSNIDLLLKKIKEDEK